MFMKTVLSLLGFDAQKHSVKTELMAGLTTFLTMSYILAVNPIILGDAGMEKGAVFSATVIAAVVATCVMALYAKMPFALASGMGLNAFFAYTLVLVMGYSWQEALAAVFIEGVFFIILTILRIREAVVNAIPINIRYSISVGIGLFIAFIGLKNGGIVVVNDATVTGLGPWTPTSVVAVSGILLGAILLTLKVRGALFYTIFIMTVVGIPFGVTQIPENFTVLSLPQSIEPVALKMEGRIHHLNKALMADAVGTTVGALCGTSTVTTYVESTTGIVEGGRTGLTALTVAGLFFLALFFSPIFLIIPSAATTSALFLVGVMMLRQIVHVDFDDFSEAMPCLMTMLMMPFAGSISEGIVLGMLSFVFVKVCSGRYREISATMYILAAFFILKYVAPLI